MDILNKKLFLINTIINLFSKLLSNFKHKMNKIKTLILKIKKINSKKIKDFQILTKKFNKLYSIQK